MTPKRNTTSKAEAAFLKEADHLARNPLIANTPAARRRRHKVALAYANELDRQTKKGK